MINRVIITGNLTNTPELKKTETGTSMIRFSIAQNQKNHTDYFNIVAFNNVAEIVARYCKKGMKVTIDGKLTTRTDINNNKYTDILLNDIDFSLPKKEVSAPVEPVEQEGDELPW